MNVKQQKLIDYTLGGFFLFLLFLPARIIRKILRRDHDVIPRKSIGVIKLRGGGSLILAFPALLGLRQQYPERDFILVTTPEAAPFAKMIGIFGQIMIIDHGSAKRLLLTTAQVWYRLLGVDTIIDLEVYSRLTGVLAILTLARNRIGFYLENVIWRKSIYTHLIFFNRFSLVTRFYDFMAVLLQAQPATMVTARQWFLAQLQPLPLREAHNVRRIALGPGCSDMAKERVVPEDYWLRFAGQTLNTDTAVEFVFLGSATDAPLVAPIVATMQTILPNAVFTNGCGRYSLLDSVRQLTTCDEYWGIDSALLHFARLLKIPATSFWGPTDPATRLLPQDDYPETVFYVKIPCSPCVHIAEEPPCQGENMCMRALAAEIGATHNHLGFFQCH